uniref:C2H2-type domain-containing protein n=1 Tax=Rhabditophanes sp. KR3021 TaxID=114890 RepID=A0AC35TX75_9BILA
MERDTFGQQLVSTYQATGMAEDGGHELGEKVTQSMNRTSEFINQIVDDKGKCMVTQVPEQIQPDSGDTFQYLTEYGKEMNEKAVRLYQTHKFIKDGRDVEVSAGGKIGVGEGEADVGGLSHSKKRTLDVNKDGKTGVGDEMVISDAGKTRYAGSYSAELRKSYQNSTSTSPFLVQESGASTTKKRRTDSYVAGTRNVVREEVVIPIKTVQKQASKQSSGLELKDKLKHSQDKGSPRSQSTSHALDKQPALQSPPTSLPNLQREARPKVGKHYSPALMRALAKNPPPSRGNGRSVSLVESTVRSILNASAPIISPVSVQVSNSVQVPNPAPVKVPSKNPAPVKVPSKNSFPGQHPLKASSPVRKSPIITSAPSAVPTSSTEEPVFKEPQIPSQFKETSNVPSSLDESKSNSKESDVPQSGTDKPNNFTHPVGYLSLLAGIRSSSKEDDITNALMQSSPNRSNINGFQNFYNTNAGDNSPIGVRKNHFNWYVNSGMDAIIPSELLLAQRLVPVTTESPSSNDQESITNSMKESVEPSESSSSNDQANRTDLEINVSSAVASKPFLNKEESFITGRGTNFFSGDWNNIWKGWKEDKQNCGDSVQGQSSLSFKGKSLSPDQGKSLYPVQEQSISPGQEQSISSGQEQSPTPGHQHSPVQERSEALKNLLASFQQRFLPFLSKEYSSPVQEHLPTPPLIQKQTSAPLHQQSCSPVQQFTPSPVLNYEPAAKKKCTPNSDLASKPFEQVSNNNLLIFPQFVNSLSQNAKTFLPSSMHVAPNANEPILRLSDERMIVPMINTNFNSQRTLKNSISTVPPNLRPNPSLSNPSLTERHLNELPIHPKPIDNVHSANLTPNVPVKKARKRPPRPAKASLQNKQNARKTENTECALSCSTFKSTNCTHLTHTDYAEPDLMRTLQEQITRGCIPSFLTADEEFAITEQTNPTPLLNQQSIGPFPTAQPHQSMVSQPLHCPTPQPHQLMVPQPLHCPTPQPHQLMVPQPLSCPTAQPQQLMTPQQFHYPTAQQLQLMFQQQLPFSTAQHQPIVSERSAFCPTAQHQQLTSSDLLSYLNQQQLMVQQNSAPTLPQQIFSPSDSMYDPQQQPKSDPPTPNPECHPPQQTSPETNVENCLNSNQNDCLVESERDAAIRATIASVIATAKEAPIKANINAAIKAAANEAAFNAANGEAGLRFASGIVQAFLSDPAQRETINGYGNIFDIPMNVLLELLKPYWNTFNS